MPFEWTAAHTDKVLSTVLDLAKVGFGALFGAKFTEWQKRRQERLDQESKRESLYIELGRNIGQVQNVVDVRRQGATTEPFRLIQGVISRDRYEAAKSEGQTFYRLGPEADVIDNFYKMFARLGNIGEMLPIEACEQTIAQFLRAVQQGQLDRRLMKKVARPWLKAQIEVFEQPSLFKRLWLSCSKNPSSPNAGK